MLFPCNYNKFIPYNQSIVESFFLVLYNVCGEIMNDVKFEDGIVYVKLLGHCSNCSIMDITLKDGIEMALINEIPEVIEVRNIDTN